MFIPTTNASFGFPSLMAYQLHVLFKAKNIFLEEQ